MAQPAGSSTTSAARPRSGIRKSVLKAPSVATRIPGRTPSLSSRGRVEG